MHVGGFPESCQTQLEMEERIIFWLDEWLENYALKSIYPNLINNVQNKVCYVAKTDAEVIGISNSERFFPIGK